MYLPMVLINIVFFFCLVYGSMFVLIFGSGWCISPCRLMALERLQTFAKPLLALYDTLFKVNINLLDDKKKKTRKPLAKKAYIQALFL